MGAISLEYRQPDESVRNRVSTFYDFHADVPLFEDVERAGLAQVRYILKGGPGVYRFADGHVAPAPRCHILGATTGPTHLSIEGPVHTFGCGLLASGWPDILDFEASLLVNRVIDAVDLFGAGAQQAFAAMAAAPDLDARVRIGESIVKNFVTIGTGSAFAFTRVVDEWLASATSPNVVDLERATGLSRRQIERNCNRYYGSPPKVLARKYRALKAAIALARGEASADTLLAEGFYDQSHLIREVKAFTGVTPRQFAKDLPTLAQLTMKRVETTAHAPLVGKT